MIAWGAAALLAAQAAACPGETITIVGSDALRPIAEALAGPCVALRLNGSDDAINAMAAGVGQVALIDRMAWEQERRPFRVIFGREPTAIRIGYHGLSPAARTHPTAVFVHPANPIAALDMWQLGRIFTRGADGGDILRWSQAGVSGPAGERRIHSYGTRDTGGFATNLRINRFVGRQYAKNFEPLASTEAVLRAVAEDRFGIAIVEAADVRAARGLKLVPLAHHPGARAVRPTVPAIRNGDYPLAPELFLYVNKSNQQSFAAVRALVARALSPAGQAVLASRRAASFTPLSARDAASELAKLAE